MNAQTESKVWTGEAGAIEGLIDRPDAALPARGVVVIAHPHPLFGGTMTNKVVQTLARAFVQCGWTAVRFNFRGVGASAGVHDNGVAETRDFLSVVNATVGEGPLAVAGFSFGAYVAARALAELGAVRAIERVVLVGTAAKRFDVPPLLDVIKPQTLVVHGEHDDTVPLAAVLDWARPQVLPVTVVPGGEHFFHGQLPLLKNLVLRHVA